MKKISSLFLFLVCCYSCNGLQNKQQNKTQDIPLKSSSTFITPIGTKDISTQRNIPTMTIELTDQINTYKRLSPGRYIIYEYIDNLSRKSLNIVSENGEEKGELITDVQGEVSLSPDNKMLAYSDETSLNILTLEDNIKTNIPDHLNCFRGIRKIAWGHNNRTIAFSCLGKIIIITIPEGEVIGQIVNPVNNNQENMNQYTEISLSHDGKWVAYYVNPGDQYIGPQGPFITDLSCIENEKSCPKRSQLISHDSDLPLTWTPDDKLALLDFRNYLIKIFDVNNNALTKSITINDGGYILESFAWSPDEEWVAIGGGLGNGIYIMSIVTGNSKFVTRQSTSVKFWLTIPE